MLFFVPMFSFAADDLINPYSLETRFYADMYHVNFHEMQFIVYCESRFDPNIQSKYIQPYGREYSWGLVQIHLKAHPHITIEQALDINFSLDFLSRHIAQGKGEQMWKICYNKWYSLGK